MLLVSYRTRFRIVLAVMLLASGCKKDAKLNDPELPPVSATGQNTFGCLINGRVFQPFFPCKHGLFTGPSEFALSSRIFPVNDSVAIQGYLIDIAAKYKRSVTSVFNLNTPAIGSGRVLIHGTGNVIDSLNIEYYPSIGNFGPFIRTTDSALRSKDAFTVTTFDSAKQVIAGDFSMTLVYNRGDLTDTAHITAGRFDFRMGQFERCDD